MDLDVGDLAVRRDLLVDLFAGVVYDFDESFPGNFVLLHGFGIRIDERHEFSVTFDDERFGHVRQGVKDVLDFLRVDVLPAGAEDKAFAATFDVEIALFVEHAEVTGV